MTEETELSFQQQSLFQQGYQAYSKAQLQQLNWGLRFTPTACSLLTLAGLWWQLPYLLLAVSLLGIWAFLAPAAHPMDLIYNHGVRHLFGAAALPPNPFQRRLACLAAGVMNAAAAGLFLARQPAAALLVGGVLLVLQAIVITTHFCALSYLYEGVMRLLGRWHRPLDDEAIRRHLREAAVLVDVRGPEEFTSGAIAGAINIPLDMLDAHLDALGAQRAVLLYCRSGMRSQIAAAKLRQAGLPNAFDAGAMSRVQRLCD